MESEFKNWRPQPELAAWLSELIVCFQDHEGRPADRTYAGADDLSDPTQILCISHMTDGTSLVVALVTHEEDLPNRSVSTFEVGQGDAIPQFADDAPTELHWRRDHRNNLYPAGWLMPPRSLATIGAQTLAHNLAWIGTPGRDQVVFASRQLLQGTPAAAVWVFRMSGAPDPSGVLGIIGEQSAPAYAPVVPELEGTSGASQVASSASPVAFSVGADPPVWFGPPPFPSPGDLVRGKSPIGVIRGSSPSVVATGKVGECLLYLTRSGTIIAESPDRSAARESINLAFTAFVLAGLPATSAADSDLQTVTDFDRTSGEIRGASGLFIARNERFSRFPHFNESFSQCFQLPENAASQLLVLAHEYGANPTRAALAGRLLDTYTLYRRGHHTESLLIAWTMVEQWLAERVTDLWLSKGRSRRIIKEKRRDWTASQQVDLLVATGIIAAADFDVIDSLRRIRNEIVHALKSATAQQAQNAIELAERLVDLPRVELSVARFDL